MVDPALSPETLWIEPGIGNFGGLFLFNFYPLMLHLYILTSMSLLDRYYGTEED